MDAHTKIKQLFTNNDIQSRLLKRVILIIIILLVLFMVRDIILRPLVFYHVWFFSGDFGCPNTPNISLTIAFILFLWGLIIRTRDKQRFLTILLNKWVTGVVLINCVNLLCFYYRNSVINDERLIFSKYYGDYVKSSGQHSRIDGILYNKWGVKVASGGLVFEYVNQESEENEFVGCNYVEEYKSFYLTRYTNVGTKVEDVIDGKDSATRGNAPGTLFSSKDINAIMYYVNRNFGKISSVYMFIEGMDINNSAPRLEAFQQSVKEYENELCGKKSKLNQGTPTNEQPNIPLNEESQEGYMKVGDIHYYSVYDNTKVYDCSLIPFYIKDVAGERFYYIKDGKHWLLLERGNNCFGNTSFNASFVNKSGHRFYCNNPSWDSGKSSSSQTSGSSSHQSVSPRPLQPVQVYHPCYSCNDSGNCSLCGGLGWTYSSVSDNGKTQCGSCGGDGKCTSCAGKGGHYEVEYR